MVIRALVSAIVGCIAMGAAVLLAGPASAQLSGDYFVASEGLRGGGFTWTFSSCGENCANLVSGGELRRQGNVWIGLTNSYCKTSIDDASLAGTYDCPMIQPLAIQLQRVR